VVEGLSGLVRSAEVRGLYHCRSLWWVSSLAPSWWQTFRPPLGFLVVVEYFASGGDREANGDWFSEGVARVTWNGLSTNFWHDSWCGKILLKTRFRQLFQLSLQPGGRVAELGDWVGSVWV